MTHRLVPDVEDGADEERGLAGDGRHVGGAQLRVDPRRGRRAQLRHLPRQVVAGVPRLLRPAGRHCS